MLSSGDCSANLLAIGAPHTAVRNTPAHSSVVATVDALSVMRTYTRQVIGVWCRALRAASLRQVRGEVQALQEITSAQPSNSPDATSEDAKLKVEWPKCPISLCGGSYLSHSIIGAGGARSSLMAHG